MLNPWPETPPHPVEATRKVDIFQAITDRILDLLEQGSVPWQQPWQASASPTNLYTKKPYRGINVMLLMMAGRPSPYWLTSCQARKLTGRIRESEPDTEILFWGMVRSQAESSAAIDASPLKKFYTVYNFMQCEGISEPRENISRIFNPNEECERIVSQMPNRPKISHGGGAAYYACRNDEIWMPSKRSFLMEQEYYCTLFHELCHATGHPSRLNRKSIRDATYFGSESYSKEDLIAEIGASFLCGISGIVNTTIHNSAAYIQNWLRKLSDDKRLIIMAAQQAQKAVDYIGSPGLIDTFDGEMKSNGGGVYTKQGLQMEVRA